MTHSGIFFYRRIVPNKCQELVRVDLRTGKQRVIHEFPEDLQTRGLGTLSPDERYYAYGVTISYHPKMFGIELVDLEKGTREIINTDPDICNPHTQFEPTEGKQIMVQHNRGCEFKPDGTRLKLVGDEGATEYLVDIPDGKVTRLQVGLPHTPSITGHEAWIAGANEILLSVRAEGEYAPDKGNLVKVSANNPQSASARRAIASTTSAPLRVVNTSSATTGRAPANSSSAISRPAKPRSYAKRIHP